MEYIYGDIAFFKKKRRIKIEIDKRNAFIPAIGKKQVVVRAVLDDLGCFYQGSSVDPRCDPVHAGRIKDLLLVPNERHFLRSDGDFLREKPCRLQANRVVVRLPEQVHFAVSVAEDVRIDLTLRRLA